MNLAPLSSGQEMISNRPASIGSKMFSQLLPPRHPAVCAKVGRYSVQEF
jgi:hypothetical protein